MFDKIKPAMKNMRYKMTSQKSFNALDLRVGEITKVENILVKEIPKEFPKVVKRFY